MNRAFLSLIFSIYALNAFSQSSLNRVANPSSLLGAYSNKQTDLFSFVGNQANLARLKSKGIGFFSEQRFSLKDNASHQLILVMGMKKINFGIEFNYSGYSKYNSSSLGIATAKKLSDKLDLGVQFNVNYENAVFNKRNFVLNFESGLIFHLTPSLNAGIHVHNPAGLFISFSEGNKNPAAYTFGLGYDASDNFHLCAEFFKEEDMPTVFQAGFQYQYRKIFLTKFSYVSNMQSICISAGIVYKSIRISVHCITHPKLGITPGVSFLFKKDHSN